MYRIWLWLGRRNSAPREINRDLAISPRETDSSASASYLASSPFPSGIATLQDRPDAIVDICFVHRLTGDRARTWTANGQMEPWPRTLLVPKLRQARILTYGYDAHIIGRPSASSNRLIDPAQNLLSDLTDLRDSSNASSRPLIFVAHSLGGLVCKRAILNSRNSPEVHLRNIFDSFQGIVFMGTPHTGAWMAEWAHIPASALGLVKSTNVMLLSVLRRDDQFLEVIQTDFLKMVRELREAYRDIKVVCFFEELPLPIFGKLVVSKDSATLDGYTPRSIRANHMDMVRFSTVEDSGFKRLFAELNRWVPQPRYEAQNPSRIPP